MKAAAEQRVPGQTNVIHMKTPTAIGTRKPRKAETGLRLKWWTSGKRK